MMVDAKAKTPVGARDFLRCLRLLCQYAIKIGVREDDPTFGTRVKMPRRRRGQASRGRLWTQTAATPRANPATQFRARGPARRLGEHAMTDAMITARTERRLQLRANGFLPIPCFGKIPAPKSWQQLTVVSADMIRLWGMSWPDARETGILCRYTPTLDLDVLDEQAAEACEQFISEHYEQLGTILVRVGRQPKRAIPFQTSTPFRKLVVNLTAANGSAEKIELLADGQQVLFDGYHPETKQPYRWHGGVPWDIARTELPYIDHAKATELINELAELLIRQHGYRRAGSPTPKSNGIRPGGGEAVWKYHLENIRGGRALHDSITQLAAMLIRSGMQSGAAVNLLAALLESSEASHDARWDARYRGIGPAIDSAIQKYRTLTPQR
jgi:hypothetical protein